MLLAVPGNEPYESNENEINPWAMKPKTISSTMVKRSVELEGLGSVG